MVQKPRSVKYKVITGYLLLFIIAVVSVWFVYTEILKIATPAQNTRDNNKIIHISNAIADLYASEALGRASILSGDPDDYKKYSLVIDSINLKIGEIKKEVEPGQVEKFDSIQLLLEKKRNSVHEIIRFGKTQDKSNPFQKAISKIYHVKDSMVSNAKPIRSTDKNQIRELLNTMLTPQQLDSLSRFTSNDSLVHAFDRVLTDVISKDNKLQNQLNQREQRLQEENRIISDQLRVILASVEKEFLLKSYKKFEESQAALSKTAKTMAWVGAITFLVLIIFAWLIIRDLSSNQRYRIQLEELNNENEQLLRSKSMLMATVTHDLQTPLGSIIGFHELLSSSDINPKQRQYLKNIKESADYILKLVNDLLDFSKLENNRITIEKTGFNIKDLVENTCKTLEPIAGKKNIELNWDIDEALNTTFLSDPYRIKQVLTNLISNSIKFTSEGSVEVTGRIENKKILISILDTGIGIAKEKHRDIFREFTQAHSGIEKKFGGTGLGLTISKRILELLGGDILLESEEGQGSIFTMVIPCEPCEITDKEVAKAPDDSVKDYLKGKKILIVDDDNTQIALMHEMFSQYPVGFTTEINSSNIISLLENGQFDIVLTDIQMPVIDGFELVKLIRAHKDSRVALVPVVALSGKRDLTADDFTGAGFTAHHPKPVQFEQLIILMANIFGSGVAAAATEKKPLNGKGLPLYNMKSLSGFTNNDPESLKKILSVFMESAKENCNSLVMAAAKNDTQKLAETAHKTIPMLKQMEVYSIAELLVPLEDRTLNMTPEEQEEYVKKICEQMDSLCQKLKEEFF